MGKGDGTEGSGRGGLRTARKGQRGFVTGFRGCRTWTAKEMGEGRRGREDGWKVGKGLKRWVGSDRAGPKGNNRHQWGSFVQRTSAAPGRVQSLLQKEVDITLNGILLEMKGTISCGGHLIMEFKDFEEVAFLFSSRPLRMPRAPLDLRAPLRLPLLFTVPIHPDLSFVLPLSWQERLPTSRASSQRPIRSVQRIGGPAQLWGTAGRSSPIRTALPSISTTQSYDSTEHQRGALRTVLAARPPSGPRDIKDWGLCSSTFPPSPIHTLSPVISSSLPLHPPLSSLRVSSPFSLFSTSISPPPETVRLCLMPFRSAPPAVPPLFLRPRLIGDPALSISHFPAPRLPSPPTRRLSVADTSPRCVLAGCRTSTTSGTGRRRATSTSSSARGQSTTSPTLSGTGGSTPSTTSTPSTPSSGATCGTGWPTGSSSRAAGWQGW